MQLKNRILLLAILYTLNMGWSHTQKPTLMVVPNDTYCIEKGFVRETAGQDGVHQAPDYQRAFQEDPDMCAAIICINTCLLDQGFPLKEIAAELESADVSTPGQQEPADNTAGECRESWLDAIKRRARADIVLDIYFTVQQDGPEKVVTFDLKGLDAYTNKQIAGLKHTGKASAGTTVGAMLRDMVYPQLPEFNNRLQQYFDNMFKNGREATIVLRMQESASMGFETVFGGNTLSTLAIQWFEVNTVNGRYAVGDVSDACMPIVARIPLYDQNKKAIDTREFAWHLCRFLHALPYGLSCQVTSRGLGAACVLIGQNACHNNPDHRETGRRKCP